LNSRGILVTVGCWVLLSMFLVCLGWENRSQPGLYYDEAVFAGMARDFLEARHDSPHMPGHLTLNLLDRPFPILIQSYLGALKSWLLMPVFGLFGSSQSVLRMANLGWSVFGILLFILWSRKLFGTRESLIAGCLLALDPSFFYLSLLDWGAAVPSFVFRNGAILLVILAFKRRSIGYFLLAGLAFGLCFFNKIDFLVFLGGMAVSSFLVWREESIALLRSNRGGLVALVLGFILGAGPILSNLPQIVKETVTGGFLFDMDEMPEKINTLLAMYDGSYFYRLFMAGGLFYRIEQISSTVWTPLGGSLLACIFLQIIFWWQPAADMDKRKKQTFILLAGVFITVGILLMPGAVRIHHTALVYPFPHLIIAFTLVGVWDIWRRSPERKWPLRSSVLLVTLVVLSSQLYAIRQTQSVIRRTGGSGWWSSALNSFCREYEHSTDISIVSMDWGFNEQLVFLTNGPRLFEPFWYQPRSSRVMLPQDPDIVYLVHPSEYALFPFGESLSKFTRVAEKGIELRPWRDKAGAVSFYSIRFLAPVSADTAPVYIKPIT